MQNNITINNLAVISGKITSNFRPCPWISQNELYIMDLAVQRLSGTVDYIPVLIPQKLSDVLRECIGQYIWTTGRFMSCNYHDCNGSHMSLSLSTDTFSFLKNPSKDNNYIFLDGYICENPVFRQTPLGCRITDLKIAINYSYLKSDYLPCICWNETAEKASRFPCGAHIHAQGRIQSRNYLKKINDEETSIRTAYEISIFTITLSNCPLPENPIS